MVVTQIDIDDNLCRFIKEFTDDHCCLELLQFFARYPRTRFSGLAVSHALNGRKLFTERALRLLINKGIIKKCVENNVPLYSLTEDEALRSLVLELAKFDRCQWQLVLRHINALIAE